MPKLYSSQAVARARLARLRLLILVAIACLVGGYLVGIVSNPPWEKASQSHHFKHPRKPSLVRQGEGSYDPKRRMCEESCHGLNGNGVCDEGRPTVARALGNKRREQDPASAAFEVLCDLGTDCFDCGPWHHTSTDEALQWQPIKQIREANSSFRAYVRQVATPQPFFIAHSDPDKDLDVSHHLHSHALFEHGFTWIWHNILKDECIDRQGSRRLVVDVGANFGYYSLIAASTGCRVIAWEPVPHFAAFFKYGLLRNNMTRAVQLRESIVTNATGDQRSMLVPQRGIWGTAGIDGRNIDRSIDYQGDYVKITKPTERVDEVVSEDVLIMKVDVEGFEPSVLFGSKNLLLQHEVKHIFMEYSPGVAERNQDWHWLEENPAVLMGLLQAGYTILHLPHDFRDKWPEWEGRKELPYMEEVTLAAMKSDLQDVWRLQQGALGCPLPAELRDSDPHLFGCGSLPEGLDPHSFRSTFEHGTNLWALRKQPWFANIGPPATLVPTSYDVKHKFFVKGGELGAARRPCLKLEPRVQVAHRCPCTDKDVCGELEQLVKQLAGEGKVAPFPVEGRTVEPEKMGIEMW